MAAASSGSDRQGTGAIAVRGRPGRVRTPRIVSAALAIGFLALSTVLVHAASAQASGSWALDCKGSATGGVSWNWLLDGTPISGAGGSLTCSGTMTATGAGAPPANTNGLTVVVYADAGTKLDTKSVTKSFDAGTFSKIQLSASASDRFCVEIEPRTCLFWTHAHERVQFSLQG